MGTVFEARDDARGVPVAVKTWTSAPDIEGRAEARLSREARALSRVEHPAVVRYVDHGNLPEYGSYLVIEWVPGETLADRLAGQGFTPLAGLELVVRLASGLAALHAQGIVHRDLKPSNVMLPGVDPASAVIVDLGIARFGASDLTGTGAHLGTPRYMAPEQIRSARSVDGRADVFALGCILFEVLTGGPAFAGADPVSVLSRILFEPAPSPRARRPELPEPLERLVRSMLEREPGRRPTAAEVVSRAGELSEGPSRDAIARLAAALRTPEGSLEPILPGSTQEDLPEAGAPPSFRVPGDAARAAVERALPSLAGGLFGRNVEEQRLTSMLRGGAHLSNVWGGPGVGKSRLVAEVVRTLVDDAVTPPWDTVVLGDLSDARDVDDVVRILAREAGVSLDPGRAPEVALGTALGKLGRTLLVADPIDHVATSLVAILREWRNSARSVQVVTVSRARFCPPGGVAIEVRPLATEPREGDPSPAAALLLARSGGHGATPEGGWDEGAHAQAEEIVRSLAGVPFAIELYAAQVPVLGLAGVLSRLERQADATLDLAEGAMRHAVAWSWELLREPERDALARCAVFRGGFFAEAAEDVLSREGPPVLELVRSLRDKSLLATSTEGAAEAPRLSLLPAVREFAAEKLRDSGNDTDVRARHAAHYARVFTPETAGRSSSLSELEREAENLLAAAEFALSGEAPDSSTGLCCLIALEPAILTRGATGSFRALLDRAVSGEADGGAAETSHLRARARQIRGRMEAPSDPPRAVAELELCLAEARRAGDVHFEAGVLVDLGVAHHLARSLDEATRCYQAALVLLAPLDDPATEARAIGNLGALSHDRRALEDARTHYRTAIALLEETGERPRRGNFLANLALIEQELGHVEAAKGLYERACALLEAVREARLLAIAVGNYGVLELESGEPARALAQFERSLRLLSGARDKRSEAICQSRIGAALALLDNHDEADGRIVRAERLARKAGDPLALEAVTLVRAVLSASRARKAGRSGDAALCRTYVREAESVVARARGALFDGRPVVDQSDDVRTTLRIIDKALTSPDIVAR